MECLDDRFVIPTAHPEMPRGIKDLEGCPVSYDVEASVEPVLARIESDELRAEIGSYLERRLLGGAQE